MRNVIQRALFPIAVLCGGEFRAQHGSLKLRFLTWLYGLEDVRPEFDVAWPEDE